MSRGNVHKPSDMEHTRGNITHPRPTLIKGKTWVKKAGMFIYYENYNTRNRPDKQEWKAE